MKKILQQDKNKYELIMKLDAEKLRKINESVIQSMTE